MKAYIIIPPLLAAALTLAGCSRQTLDSARQDTQHNIDTAKPQLAKLSLGARVAATLKAAGLNGIRVDADANGVSLHGSIDSASDRARAGRIARDTLGPDKRVSNQLVVRQ